MWENYKVTHLICHTMTEHKVSVRCKFCTKGKKGHMLNVAHNTAQTHNQLFSIDADSDYYLNFTVMERIFDRY